ncbi:hypothetical protein JOB18_048451 [Solea senegalensis]|uniref:Uncharacterized protein n=1 Tax=Solea senegalensis TaxID=28829 RepID=A0AAV6RUH4_SOLSE|nr:hypothetical protein JOB18_048451 [Solea senegalensis]
MQWCRVELSLYVRHDMNEKFEAVVARAAASDNFAAPTTYYSPFQHTVDENASAAAEKAFPRVSLAGVKDEAEGATLSVYATGKKHIHWFFLFFLFFFFPFLGRFTRKRGLAVNTDAQRMRRLRSSLDALCVSVV